MTREERIDDMLMRYGECCTKTVAARILGRGVRYITSMLDDGRLSTACAGKMVDVRSIAEYVTAPAESEEKGRIERMKRKYATDWAV